MTCVEFFEVSTMSLGAALNTSLRGALVSPTNQFPHSGDVDHALHGFILQNFTDRFTDVIDVYGRYHHRIGH